MAGSAAQGTGPGPGTSGMTAGDSRKWLILGVICVSYLMVTLDLTVMNLALPSAQHALGFTNADRQWIVTAYALSFGSLLLFCGRLADLIGRKVTILIGLAGFAAASAVGGASVNFTMLVTARACQGVFAALLAPAAVSLLTTTFTDPKERGKAFGTFGATAASGVALGLLIGGALTSYLSWRWCLYINLVFAGIAITGAVLLLGRQPKVPGARLDVPGVALVSGGMFCLVYGFSNAATHNWRTPSTSGFLAAGVALLIVFAYWQSRASQPLLPARVILDRNRGGAYITALLGSAAMFGIFLFLVYYMQLTLGYSPIISGVALLPMVVVIVATTSVGNRRLMPRMGPKPLVIVGMLVSAASMVWLTRIGVHSGYASTLLGPLIANGFGMGLVYAARFDTGVFGVEPRDSGVASASINTGQQLGGSIGIALLNTIFAGATVTYLAGHSQGRPAPQLLELAAVHSYIAVFWWCAGIFAVGSVICGTLLRSGPLRRGAVTLPGNAPPENAPIREPSQQGAAARSMTRVTPNPAQTQIISDG
jgi:EmrB/QacA subfamily drug resistance transporter